MTCIVRRSANGAPRALILASLMQSAAVLDHLEITRARGTGLRRSANISVAVQICQATLSTWGTYLRINGLGCASNPALLNITDDIKTDTQLCIRTGNSMTGERRGERERTERTSERTLF